jgi:hypothetical protein
MSDEQRIPQQLHIGAAKWTIWAGKATVFALIVGLLALVAGVVALIVGYLTYQQDNQFQRQAAATGVLQNYMATAAEHADAIEQPYTDDAESELNDEYGWVAANGIFAAETIYHAADRDDEGWMRTAASIVKDHQEFVLDRPWREAPDDESPWFRCDYYSEDFIMFMQKELGKSLQC